jgi:hypothetical protein
MKRLITLFLAGAMLLGFAACGEAEEKPSTTENAATSQSGAAPQGKGIPLVAAFGPEEDSWKRYQAPFADIENLGFADIADALTELTGIDFSLNSAMPNPGLSVLTLDFSSKSALTAGPPEPQKEEFHMYDRDSLVFFMLDSLYFSIIKNMPLWGDERHDVYFTLGGAPILTESMGELPDAPYTGSGSLESRGDLIENEPAMG